MGGGRWGRGINNSNSNQQAILCLTTDQNSFLISSGSHVPKERHWDRTVISDATVQLALCAGEYYLGSKKHYDVESSELNLVSQ